MRINLVSSPRNRSTLLMYSFAQRSDTSVVDEPYYAYFFKWSGIDHPGRDDVLDKLSADINEVQTDLLKKQSDVLFIKNMAHHYQHKDFHYLLDFTNVLYIRDPRAIIRSYSKVIEQPVASDVGINQVKRINDFLIENNQPVIILDSDDLVRDPEKTLSLLCKRLGLDFEEHMLHWPAGPKTYDGVWARHWYSRVHQSTGFIVNENTHTETIALTPEQEQLAKECMPAYKALKQYALTA